MVWIPDGFCFQWCDWCRILSVNGQSCLVRFGCPMAAILGVWQTQSFKVQELPVTVVCISCGNCSTYCEMGIDVKSMHKKVRILFVPVVSVVAFVPRYVPVACCDEPCICGYPWKREIIRHNKIWMNHSTTICENFDDDNKGIIILQTRCWWLVCANNPLSSPRIILYELLSVIIPVLQTKPGKSGIVIQAFGKVLSTTDNDWVYLY